MFAPSDFVVSVLMSAVATICWGSWSVLLPISKLSFLRFYSLYTVGLFIFATSLCLLFGSATFPSTNAVICSTLPALPNCTNTLGCAVDAPFLVVNGSSVFGETTDGALCVNDDFLANLFSRSTPSHFLYAFASGVTWKIANILLVVAIELAGFAIAFPIAIGFSLVEGTLITYVIEPKGRLAIILLGLGFATAAILLDAFAYRSRNLDLRATARQVANVIEPARDEEDARVASDRAEGKVTKRKTVCEGDEDGTGRVVNSSDRDALLDGSDVKAVVGEEDDQEPTKIAEEGEPNGKTHPRLSRLTKGLLCCLVCGVLMGAWTPLMTASQTAAYVPLSDSEETEVSSSGEGVLFLHTKPSSSLTGSERPKKLLQPFSASSSEQFIRYEGLNPYASFFSFCFGACVIAPIMLLFLKKYPLHMAEGDKAAESTEVYREMSTRQRVRGTLLGLISGLIWAIGTIFNFVAGRNIGFAISYAIGQSAPMIAAVWGVALFKEFQGTSVRSKILLAFMFVSYMSAITALANSR